ncbi:hypothetical protein UlMin_014320 [Ulmus minor]
MKKGTWTPEEDRMLVAYVTRYGCWNWRQLPKFAGLKRCGKSCRLRWMNYLRPNIKRGNYTKEEEETIIRLHASLGNKWSAIAAELEGRTDNEIKNHWHTHLKRRVNRNSHTTHKEKEDEAPSMSSQPSSSEDSATSIATDTTTSTETSNATNSDPIETLFGDFNDSFWTEPFLADNIYFPSGDHHFAMDTLFLSSPVFDDTILSSTSDFYHQEHEEPYDSIY